MRIFKNKHFNKWARGIGIEDKVLKAAIDEISTCLYEANLGGHLFKKRLAISGNGKRGGVRTIIAFKNDDKAFFMYGFAKNQRANIDNSEETIYKKLAKLLLAFDDNAINTAIKNNELVEVLL